MLERDRSTERLVPESLRLRMPHLGSSRARNASLPGSSRLRELMIILPQIDYKRGRVGLHVN
jgi:hypothetical protein